MGSNVSSANIKVSLKDKGIKDLEKARPPPFSFSLLPRFLS